MTDAINIEVVVPVGAFGASVCDDQIDTAMRQIAVAFQQGGEWAEKYGTIVDNDVFQMNPFCWCGSEECRWCGSENAPNFHFKATGFKVWWYKYIGRSVDVEGTAPDDMVAQCLAANDT